MTRSPPLLPIAFATALAMASAAHAGAPAVCNGKHKRPANPYGSVLATGVKPDAATRAAPAPAAETPPKPVAVSRVERASFAACGKRA